MMFAPVVVDLGPDVGRREVQIVIDACSSAISQGVCVPGASTGDEPPRAVAVARAADDAVRVVRIEVRMASDDGGEPIVRELAFGRRDPLRERWRSVGLAIATLVGEGEQRAREEAEEEEAEEAAEPAPPEPPPTASEPEPASPQPVAPEASPPPPPAVLVPERRDEPEAEEEPDAPRMPFEHRSVFIGVGASTGPGVGASAWRVGGALRGAWQAQSGLSVGASIGYAWRASTRDFTSEWLSVAAGVGYRFTPSDALSFGALLLGGAQRARFQVLAAGVERSAVRWNPRAGVELDARWRATSGFGFWTAVEASSTGRASRLFVTPDRDPIRSAPVDFSAAVGLGWWIE